MEKALARTYQNEAYLDPWDAVEQYREVMDYHSRNPNTGRGYLSRRFEIPEGRVREWLDGSQPPQVHAIQTASDHGWLPRDDEPVPLELLKVVAWLLAAGSIDADGYVPMFVISNPDQQQRLADLLTTLGVGMRTVERGPGRSVEGKPRRDASILGRVCVALGVPTGERLTDITTVPDVLTSAPDGEQREIVATYLYCRAEHWEWADQYVITHRDAPRSYLESLCEWISDSTGVDCTVTEQSVQVPAASIEDLSSP